METDLLKHQRVRLERVDLRGDLRQGGGFAVIAPA